MHLVQVRSGVADFSYRGLARKGIGDGWPHHPWKARKDRGDGGGGGDGDVRYFDRRGDIIGWDTIVGRDFEGWDSELGDE